MGIVEDRQVVINFHDAAARDDVVTCLALLAEGLAWMNIAGPRQPILAGEDPDPCSRASLFGHESP